MEQTGSNAIRHSGTDSCQVIIDCGAGELAIEIRDRGIRPRRRGGALYAGASGFLVKAMALDDILAAVRTVATGDARSHSASPAD